jgi:hypothetical protein
MNPTMLEAAPGAEVRIPLQACYLQALTPIELAAAVAAEGDEGAPKTRPFSMVALSGKPLSHWWYGQLGIDLAGIRMKQKLPVLMNHRTDLRVGFTTALRVDKTRGLIAEGSLMLHSEAAAEVMADSDAGFPWQASTYFEPHKVLRLAEGEESELNGGTMVGPGVIFRECTLREVTFTALGVDDDTSATSLSADAGEVVAVLSLNENMTTKQPAANAAPVAAAPAPAVPEVDSAKLTQDAAEAERKRANVILESAADAQIELARKLIADGVALSDALLQLNQDLKVRLAAKKPTAAAAAAEPLAAGNSAEVLPRKKPAPATDAAELAEDDLEVQWAESAKLRAEFGGDKNVWLAYCRNKHRCKDYGTRAQLDAAQTD